MTIRHVIALSGFFLAGCPATTAFYSKPIEQQYVRLDWASASVQQAHAECRAAVQANPMMGFPVCMRAKGWQEVR